MRYIVKPTGKFVKDYKLAKRRGMKMSLLEDVIAKLANGEALEKKHCDHELASSYKGYRECHILPDWLLVYRIDEDVLVLTLTRTGSHSDLF